MWTAELAAWYAEHGRHHLPWRLTRDPWAVLVSEVMLQQTSVGRVLPRWEAFLRRWPSPQECAAAPLDDVLREWDGLGYPRRAAGLHRCAVQVARGGWPRDEAGLRALPGIGAYTARALLAFAFGSADVPPPRDVNLGRVAARAVLGVEPHEVAPSRLDEVLAASRPASVGPREHAYALFDLGATVCRARRPSCEQCPLAGCASRARLRAEGEGKGELLQVKNARRRVEGAELLHEESAPGGRVEGGEVRAPRRQAPYHGSMRQLRGAVLRALLDEAAPTTWEELRERVAAVPAAARSGAIEAAVAGLRSDGLLGREWPTAG